MRTQLAVAVVLALAACPLPEPQPDRHDAPPTGIDESTDEPTPEAAGPDPIRDPGLVATAWPDGLHAVETVAVDDGVVVLGRDSEGRLVARIELAVAGPSIYAIRSQFADGETWTVVDLDEWRILSSGFDGGVAEPDVELRIGRMIDVAAGVAVIDPMGPQAGPWLDCALQVLSAVAACLPSGGFVFCPDKIIEAVCTCHEAVVKTGKGKRKRKKLAVCSG